jgi:hypothetical protein
MWLLTRNRLPAVMRCASYIIRKKLLAKTTFDERSQLLYDTNKQKDVAAVGIPQKFQTRFLLFSTGFHRGLCLFARTRPFSKRSKGPRPHLENINELPAAVDDVQRTYTLRAPGCIRLSRKGAALSRRETVHSCIGDATEIPSNLLQALSGGSKLREKFTWTCTENLILVKTNFNLFQSGTQHTQNSKRGNKWSLFQDLNHWGILEYKIEM